LRPTQIFDAQIEVLKGAKRPLKSRQRVRVHIGTLEALARVQVLNEANEIGKGEKDFVQFTLEIPVVAIPNERFIIRSYSPQITIAGGRILDALATKHRRKDVENVRKNLNNLIEAAGADDKVKQVKFFLETANENGLTVTDLQARTGWLDEILRKAIAENVEKKAIVEADNFYVARTPFENLKTKTLAEIENQHRREPLAKGILRETLREKIFSHLAPEIFKTTLVRLEKEGKISAEKDFVRAISHNQELSADETKVRERLFKIYTEAKLEVPTLENALNDSTAGTKLVREHARGKARSVAAGAGDRPVLGVDTAVVLGDTVFGKPADVGDAERMLEALAGTTHLVVSGLCLITPGWELVEHETTRVTFRSLTPRDLAANLGAGEWQGRAGAYAIQGRGAALVERIQGDYLNVVGLPAALLVRLLGERFPGSYGFG